MKSSEMVRGASRPAASWTNRREAGPRRLAGMLIIAALVFLAASPSSATPTTYDVSFSANGFQVGSGPNPVPVDPVTGSFKITLDPTIAVLNSTSGITMNSLNISLGSAISYSYNPAVEGAFPAGTLRVGGVNLGADTIQFTPSTNDFWLFIENFTTTPAFRQVGYTQTTSGSNNLFFTPFPQTAPHGSVGVTLVPEPTSLFALCSGLACVGGVLRRRKR